MKHLVLYSGGPDSFITLHKVISEERGDLSHIQVLYFDLGHRYRECERRTIQETFPATIILTELESLGTLEEVDATIWHRNAFLCLAAARFADPLSKTVIYLTVQKDELSIPDRKPKFLDSMGFLLQSLDQNIEIRAPFLHMDKTDMVSWFLASGGNGHLLRKTWSCYAPKNGPEGTFMHCGDCPACIRRYIAFSLSGVYTYPNDYYCYPKSSKTAEVYVAAAKAGKYSPERRKRILDALC
jgi:7-cyano-7-deazaguanine synthase in queuosine biosynthesis